MKPSVFHTRPPMLWTLFLWFTFLSGSSFAQNPFSRSKGTPSPSVESTSWFQPIITQIQTWQYSLQETLAEQSMSVQSGEDFSLVFFLMGVAFVYGAVHTLGPGHGKCVVCSYFVSEDASVKKGLMLGYLVAFIHAASAFTVVAIIDFMLRGASQSTLQSATHYTSIFAYGLIALLGAWMLCRYVLQSVRKTPAQVCEHDHYHGHHCEHPEHHHEQQASRALFWVALGIGVVPCPGSLMILLFSMSLDFVSLGVLLAGMMAVGMGVTISLLSLTTILSRKGLVWWAGRHERWWQSQKFEQGLRILGAGATFCFGFVFFLAASTAL